VRDGTLPPAASTTVTLYSYYDPSGGHHQYTSSYDASTQTYTYEDYIDQAKTKPYFVEYSGNSPSYFYSYAENYSLPPQTVTVTIPKSGVGLGFGSMHASGMNVLLCDGSVHVWNYGTPQLTELIRRNDGLTPSGW
jgi:prepilin-type processing-associated H-X9-DG protein